MIFNLSFGGLPLNASPEQNPTCISCITCAFTIKRELSFSRLLINVRIFNPQGADFKNNQTTKQVNNSIWTNRKQVKFCFYLPIGPNKNC